MIHGIGVDIVEIARIKRSLERFADHFEKKIFTENEIEYCRSKSDPSKHFAGRFAVKEAVMKSLGMGMGQGVDWKDIEVLQQETGQPILRIQGRGRNIFDGLRLKEILVSISHENSYAVGQAIAVK